MLINTPNPLPITNNLIKKTPNLAFRADFPPDPEEQSDFDNSFYASGKRHFTPQMGFYQFIKALKKGKAFPLEKDLELGKKIYEGRIISDIYAVYYEKNAQILKQKLQNYEQSLAFLQDISPRKTQALRKKLEKTPNQSLILNSVREFKIKDNPKSTKHPFIKALNEKYEINSTTKIVNFISSSLYEGEKALKLKNRVEQYEKEGRFAQKQLQQIKQGIIPKDWNKIIAESENAHHQMINNYKFLLATIASRHPANFELTDAISEGFIGLNNAARKYDYTTGNPFKPYAFKLIRFFIANADKDKSDAVRLPRYLYKSFYAQTNARKMLEKKELQPASSHDIASESGMSISDYDEVERLKKVKNPISLSSPVENAKNKDTEGSSLESFIKDEKNGTPEDAIFKKDQNRALNELLRQLIPDENAREVLHKRIFLDQTLQSIGDQTNPPVSREWIRQIEEKAIIRVRKQMRDYMEIQRIPAEEKQEITEKMQAILSEKENQAVRLKFGLDSPDGKELSYTQVGIEIGNSLSWARQNCLNAMEKLEKAGITQTDVKKLRQMPLFGELLNMYKDITNNNKPSVADGDDY